MTSGNLRNIAKLIWLKVGLLINIYPKNVTCPCCGWTGRAFLERRGTKNARCPKCDSLTRHRWLYIELEKLFNQENIPINPKILHVAPEISIQPLLKKKGGKGYISIDLAGVNESQQADLTNLHGFTSNYYDLIFVSHALEHVDNDVKAMNEIYRVLKPKTGIAIICVPINLDLAKGYAYSEDQMLKHPDQHVREYGRNFFQILRRQGFTVTIIKSLPYSSMARTLYGFGSPLDIAALCRRK